MMTPYPPKTPAMMRREAEERVFELARQQNNREVITAVNELERQGSLSFAMAMQRLHALQNLRDYKEALKLAEELARKYPQESELALFRADLLAVTGKWSEAQPLLRQVVRDYAGTKIGRAHV